LIDKVVCPLIWLMLQAYFTQLTYLILTSDVRFLS